jgi:hypothetical protein
MKSDIDDLLKTSIELSEKEEIELAKTFKDAHFILQKKSARFPMLASSLLSNIQAVYDRQSGSISMAMKSLENTTSHYRKHNQKTGRHITTHCTDMSNKEKEVMRAKHKVKLQKSLDAAIAIKDKLIEMPSDFESENRKNDLSNIFKEWELTPRVREQHFLNIRMLTSSYRKLTMKCARLIKEETSIRYKNAPIDFFIENKLMGMTSKNKQKILSLLSNEIAELERLSGCSVSNCIKDAMYLLETEKEMLSARNKLTITCKKQINYAVDCHARDMSLNDSDKADLIQNMFEVVLSKAIYHFDGQCKLATYIQSYLKQAKSEFGMARRIIKPSPALYKRSTLYHRVKIELENRGEGFTMNDLVNLVNERDPNARATVQKAKDIFESQVVDIDNENKSFSEDSLILVNDAFEQADSEKMERAIFETLQAEYSREMVNLFMSKFGLLSTRQMKYRELQLLTGLPKDLIRRKIAEMQDHIKEKLEIV